ncbi:MAG: globin family protein [Leptolyngbyaceae cyanobacterium]
MFNVERLEHSFAQIKEREPEFTATFYKTLFANSPEVKPLFRQVDMQEQGKKLFASLSLVVANLRNPDNLALPLMAMGVRHAGYGVSASHYPMVGQAMLQALAVTLGSDWTPELQQSWLEAYRVVADVMLKGADRPTFKMKLSQVLQGEFQVQKLNLLLVFQVNCPGCFVYALPLAARLHDRHGDRLNILGLSTAFEDFSFNTLEHTRRLLESGEVFGMTKLYWQRQGESSYSVPIRFPVAFDLMTGTEPQARATAENTPLVSDVGYTFRTNQLQGTPSWILFDEGFTILAEWFGHKAESEVESILKRSLSANSVDDAIEQPL